MVQLSLLACKQALVHKANNTSLSLSPSFGILVICDRAKMVLLGLGIKENSVHI
jgi:hypothetical protein